MGYSGELNISYNNDDCPKTVVIDTGIATEENLEKLRADKRFEYVAVSQKKIINRIFLLTQLLKHYK